MIEECGQGLTEALEMFSVSLHSIFSCYSFALPIFRESVPWAKYF